MTIAEFLVKLANDDAERDAFQADPRGYLETRSDELNLTSEQIDMLASGRLKEIRYIVEADMEVDRAGDEGKETTTISFVRPVWGFMPWPVWFQRSSGDESQEPPE